MKNATYAAAIAMLSFAGQVPCRGQDVPELPKPQKQHEWLQQLVGNWDTESEVTFAMDVPPIKCTGTQKARMLGGFWLVAEGTGEMMGTQIETVFMLGYDSQKKKYVGTWTDSCQDYMWKYEGALNDTGKTLTLRTEGPNMLTDGAMTEFREVIEIKSKDHYVFSSALKGDDGKWNTFVTVNFRRQK